MNELTNIASQYNVSESALRELMAGIQRRIATLPAETIARMQEDREFAAGIMQSAATHYFEEQQKFYDRYFNDEEYRTEVRDQVREIMGVK